MRGILPIQKETVQYKFLIIDDHPLVREGLSLVISSIPGGATIFTAGSAAEALEKAELHSPFDAVLLVCSLPDANGENLIGALRRRTEGVVVVVSGDEAGDLPARMLKRGAAGFVKKSQASTQILQALLTAMRQGNAPAPGCGAADASAALEEIPAQLPALTARQLDVLLMLDQGKTNRDIALVLGLSEKTVKNHVTALFASLGVVNRLQAVSRARTMRLLN